jgi:hypothetical protein
MKALFFIFYIFSGALSYADSCPSGEVSMKDQSSGVCSCKIYVFKDSYLPCGQITETSCASGFQKATDIELAKKIAHVTSYINSATGPRAATFEYDHNLAGYCQSTKSMKSYYPLEYNQNCATGYIATTESSGAASNDSRICSRVDSLGEEYKSFSGEPCLKGYTLYVDNVCRNENKGEGSETGMLQGVKNWFHSLR